MKYLCVSLFVLVLVAGCGKQASPRAEGTDETPSDVSGKAVAKGPASEVSFTLPDLEKGNTHALYAQGTFNTLSHDFSSPFEFTMDGKLNYRLRFTFKKFVKDDWCINPLMDVTNDTGDKMYMAYYVAFFDADDKLVGACSQANAPEPNGKPMQLASLVISGPKELLSVATRFKMVIYESNKQIGAEPLSPEFASEFAADKKVASILENADKSVSAANGYKRLYIQSPIQYGDPSNNKNTHVRIEATTKYTFYLQVKHREALIVHHSPSDGEKREERFVRWEADFNFDPMKRVKGCYAKSHAALLNQDGQLVVCKTENKNWSFSAPQDALLNASQLNFVAYEFQN